MWVEHIYISTEHNFFGHHGKEPGSHPMIEVDEAQCVAHKGIRGDRFFAHKRNYKGQITFFSLDVYEDLCRELHQFSKSPSALRRNIIVSGINLNCLIGQHFTLQKIQFLGMEECSPCSWMEQAFGSGAQVLLQGRGGLRAKILSDGILKTDHPECSHF